MILQLCDGAKRSIMTKSVKLLLGVYHILSKDSFFNRFNGFLDGNLGRFWVCKITNVT